MPEFEFHEVPAKRFPVNEEGWHLCSNCGFMWWATHVVFDEYGEVQAFSMEATCGECGFPLMGEVDDAGA